MKNEKGITLIALVITIIVLLILAGASLAMLTGDNGVLTNAETAKQNTKEGTIKDKIDMELNAFRSDLLVDGKVDYVTMKSAVESLGSTYIIKVGSTTVDSAGVASTTAYEALALDFTSTSATITIENSELGASKKITGSIDLTSTDPRYELTRASL